MAATCPHWFFGEVDACLGVFEHDESYLRCPLRRLFDSPAKMVGELGVGPGQVVLDAGAGFGYFALEAAARVGPGGVVYAVEPDGRRAAAIRRAAQNRGLRWVVVLETRLELGSSRPGAGRQGGDGPVPPPHVG